MFYTSIPGTQLRPSVISLGVAGFGSETPLDESFAMLDEFAEAGGNVADSAHIYAAWRPDGVGTSERTLGQWLRSRAPKDFIVSTKGGHPHLETMDVSRLSPECLASDVNDSLERLGVNSIDLYWLHRDDPQIPAGEIIDALNTLRAAGHLNALGASNWTTRRIDEANAYAGKNGLTGFCASQIGWSLARLNDGVKFTDDMQYMTDETLRWHGATGFPAFAYSSQANGFFAHAIPPTHSERTEKQQNLANYYLNEENAARYHRAGELAARLGRSRNEVALASIWSHAFPVVAIIGTRVREQLMDSLRAADLKLSADDLAFLESAAC